MSVVIRFCLVCWFIGGALVLGALLDWKLFHLSYLINFTWGKNASRIFTCMFGLILLCVGFLIFLAPE